MRSSGEEFYRLLFTITGMSFVTDIENERALMYAIMGFRMRATQSLKPPTSLSHPSTVPLLLSCKYFVVESWKVSCNFVFEVVSAIAA